MRLYAGTSGYAYKEWKGSFYPPELPAGRMLNFYGAHFRAVEINNSFYRMPTAALLRSWADEVPENFKFALKAPQRITHRQRLAEADESVAALLDAASVLKARLGPLLFQLPPDFKKDVPRLRDFLDLLPPHCRAAFEFRHVSWFDDEVYALLRENRVALCIAETGDGIEVPLVATADWGYLRLRRPDYGDAELKAWARRVRQQNWHDAFVFFKYEEAGRGPQLAQRFLELAG